MSAHGMMKREDVHDIILSSAKDEANQEWATSQAQTKIPQLKSPFHPFPGKSTRQGFTLTFDADNLHPLSVEDRKQVVAAMHDIGTRAVTQAIKENIDLFVGAFMGLAKKHPDVPAENLLDLKP